MGRRENAKYSIRVVGNEAFGTLDLYCCTLAWHSTSFFSEGDVELLRVGRKSGGV